MSRPFAGIRQKRHRRPDQFGLQNPIYEKQNDALIVCIKSVAGRWAVIAVFWLREEIVFARPGPRRRPAALEDAAD